MIMLLGLLGQAFCACIVIAVVGWIVSIIRHDSTVADLCWSLFPAVCAIIYIPDFSSITTISALVFSATLLCSLRLFFFILSRLFKKEEDRRYAEIRRNWGAKFGIKSLPGIFLLQAMMGYILTFPMMIALRRTDIFTMIDLVLLCIWLAGFLCQSFADYQLQKFSKSDNGSGLLKTGLWKYSRHPNYFGELCMVWSIYGIAVLGGGAWTIFAPLLISWSVWRFSGIDRMEKGMSNRRPGYDEYSKKTSALIPWFPRGI